MAFGLGKDKDKVKQNSGPEEKYFVKVVAKRMWIGGSSWQGTAVRTEYFMTFERIEDQYRWQFGVCGNQYGIGHL